MKKNSFFVLYLILLSTNLLLAQKTIQHYLSGKDKDHTVEWDFYCTKGQNSGKWTKIAVPSQWEQQGFGNYNYGRDKNKSDEQGLYKHNFFAPGEWKNKRSFIVFEGSMTDTEVKINGHLAGAVHQGGFYRFKYEITGLLKPGENNLLEVSVSKKSANNSINIAELGGDYWIYGGIYRPVYLEVVPQSYIDRVAIDAKADGSFAVEVFPDAAKTNYTIEARIQKLNEEETGGSFTTKILSSREKYTLKTKINDPVLWNPESPNLYRVKVDLKDDKGVILHTVTQRFGFRTIEIRPKDGIYVNGQKVTFKGVNHHSHWPETGRTLSRDIHLLDIGLIKDMNMNAVRMSHYPPDQEFLDLCDSLGLFVLDEVAGWQAAYDTTIGHKIVKETVIRDVNHPGIILWDNGNEGGWNRALDGDYAFYDPQKRPVIHPWEKYNGTDTKHYPNYNYVVNSAIYGQDIYFPTEFMHGLYDGGMGAGLDDFWSILLRHPHAAGGFLWVFHDEATARTDKNGWLDTDRSSAPDGIVGPHREKEASYYTVKEIWSPVHIEKRLITPDFDGRIDVENRYMYTNLNQCTFEWKLVSFPKPADNGLNYKVNATGNPQPLNLAPGEKGILKIDFPTGWQQNDALFLTAYGPDKKEVFTWSWAIQLPFDKTSALINKTVSKTKITVYEQDNRLIIKSDSISYHFDKITGYIEKIAKNKTDISLSGGPVLAGVQQTLKQFSHHAEEGKYFVEANYEGNQWLRIKWIFSPGSPVKLEYMYAQGGEQDFMGITFKYPESKITGVKWMGRGPYRVWKNRLKGQQLGIWHKNYNDAITGETWQYPEFKGYHAELYWAIVETKEAPFTIYTENENIFLQMLKPTKPAGAYNDYTHPPFPEGNIGFMNAISPIGTKFQTAELMGPQSQKNMQLNYTPISGVLWFDFR